ncbi:unnamed protein product, partial [Notodromas monacha]
MTDIDDKIIKRSRERNVSPSELAKKYEDSFMDDMAALFVRRPSGIVRVSEHVENIQRFVQTLMDKKLAYRSSSGSVYFDTRAFESSGFTYGKFVPLNTEECAELEDDVGSADNKKNRKDFALWKAVKPLEPSWDSRFGPGRPGWHIECSAMASQVFGDWVDIHSGGTDLIFPHHENEEAQSCAFHGNHQWVGHWIHTEIDYSEETLALAGTVLAKFNRFMKECDEFVSDCGPLRLTPKPVVDNIFSELTVVKEKIVGHLKNDFKTAGVIRCLEDLMKQTQAPSSNPVVVVGAVADLFKKTLNGFGFQISNQISSVSSTNEAVTVESLLNSLLKFRMQDSSNGTKYEIGKDEKPEIQTNKLRKCTVIAGDGIGPEMMDAVYRVFEALAVPIEFEEFIFSELHHTMSAKAENVMTSIARNGVCIMGKLMIPDQKYFSELGSLSIRLRKDLDLYANVVTIETLPGLDFLRHKNLDFFIIRENTEGEMSNMEHVCVPV